MTIKAYTKRRFADAAAERIVAAGDTAVIARKDDKFAAFKQPDLPEGWEVIDTLEPKKPDGSVVPLKYKQRYGALQHCGDEVAEVLSASTSTKDDKGHEFCDAKKIADVARQNGVDISRWAHLNVGMQRMNLGNVLRARVNRGEFVVIGGTTWNKEEAKEHA